MTKTDYLETEPHTGICGHCASSVDAKASTCPNCNAYWGLKEGIQRDDLYQSAIRRIRFSRNFLYCMLLMSVGYLVGMKFLIGPLYFGSLFCFFILLPTWFVAKLRKKRALDKTNGEVDWWIKR